ncbi:putative germin-like protein 9-2 [Prunus dulcis]|uniref:putative germin-like protein 9-2 n=1 Tax=Prunus dulcis TaxID=3755 RepID=UPI001482CBB0|nr:putative germin-like protein 9-2 [Prunus dulcis]
MASSTSTRPGQNVFRPIYKRNQERPPDIVSYFTVAPATTVDANFFTFTRMRALVGGAPPSTFKVLKATLAEFSALNGQCLLYRPSIPIWHYEPPHTHPRSAELLFLVDGTLGVGFVDTKNHLFTQTLQAGDLFVFPKGSALPAQC